MLSTIYWYLYNSKQLFSESKFILQSILETQDKNAREMSLKDEGLTSLYHTEWMLLLTSIDLSNNALSTVKSLSNLRCLKCLCLDNNHLKDLDGLQHCHQLCELSVKINGKKVSLDDNDTHLCEYLS